MIGIILVVSCSLATRRTNDDEEKIERENKKKKQKEKKAEPKIIIIYLQAAARTAILLAFIACKLASELLSKQSLLLRSLASWLLQVAHSSHYFHKIIIMMKNHQLSSVQPCSANCKQLLPLLVHNQVQLGHWGEQWPTGPSTSLRSIQLPATLLPRRPTQL